MYNMVAYIFFFLKLNLNFSYLISLNYTLTFIIYLFINIPSLINLFYSLKCSKNYNVLPQYGFCNPYSVLCTNYTGRYNRNHQKQKTSTKKDRQIIFSYRFY